MERPQQEYHTHVVRTRGSKAGNVWLSGFAIGAAVGSVLGLLWAPRKGSELRMALMENLPGQALSSEYRTKINEMLASGRTSPSDLASQAQRELDDLRSRAINKLDDAKLRGEILQKQAELRYLQGKEKLRRTV